MSSSVLYRGYRSVRDIFRVSPRRTRPTRSSRRRQLNGLERLDGRQMLAADATTSAFYDIYDAYTNSAVVNGSTHAGPTANYWRNVSSIGGISVVAANGQPGLAPLNNGTGGGGVVSETLGYSMILAALYDDKATFDRLSATVQVAASNNATYPGLVPWTLTTPSSGSTSWAYSDPNSAADGDINIALSYVYADKAADVYGWSATPGQGGDTYHDMAASYIAAIRTQDFSQDDPNSANRYLLAEGAAQSGHLGGDGVYYGGFSSNLWHYDYSDLRAYELFTEYDQTPSNAPQRPAGEYFWDTASYMTNQAYKAIFYFGSQDTGRTEVVAQGAIDPVHQFVKLSNNSYTQMQASFNGYASFAMTRASDSYGNLWNEYTADCQRFPIRWTNWLYANAGGGTTGPAWSIGLTNLQSLGASFLNSYDANESKQYERYDLPDRVYITPDDYANAAGYEGITSYNAAGLLAWAGNSKLQPYFPAAAQTIVPWLEQYFSYYLTPTNDVPSDWDGYATTETVYGPAQGGFHGEWPTAWNAPDAFQDSLTLWGLTVYENGQTPLQEYMVTYEPQPDNGAAPTVVGFANCPSATYTAGQSLQMTVNFSEPVTVTGSPAINLLLGNSRRQAVYVSGSGTSALTFAYVVRPGERAAKVVVGQQVALPAGAAIVDLMGNAPVGTAAQPALWFAAPKSAGVKVDGVVPVVRSVVVGPPGKAYVAGENVAVRVSFNRPVEVAGAPSIPVTVGGTTRQAVYIGGTGTRTLLFSVQPAVGDAGAVQVGSALVLNGGGIRDHVGNSLANLGLPVANTQGVLVEANPPWIASVQMPGSVAGYRAGEWVTMKVTFSKPVFVRGLPFVGATVGSADRRFSYVSGSGTATLVFRYRVHSGDGSNAIRVQQSLGMAFGTIRDGVGNLATWQPASV